MSEMTASRAEMGTRRGLAHPCNEQTDDDQDEGPQRARGRQCDSADDRGDCWEAGKRTLAQEAGCGGMTAAAGCEDGDVDPCWQEEKGPSVSGLDPGGIDEDAEDRFPCWEEESRRARAQADPCNEADDAQTSDCSEDAHRLWQGRKSGCGHAPAARAASPRASQPCGRQPRRTPTRRA